MEKLAYTLRLCTPADLDRLLVLIGKHAEFEKAHYSPEGKKEQLHAALFTEPVFLTCVIAEVDRVVIGYATYTFDYSTWDAAKFIYLDCLYIEDEYRSYGIGKHLMDWVKKTGEENDCVNMQWQTPDFNERAIQFYKRLGGIGKDKVRFTLPLNLRF
ncbi:GNAT family N-acetyltransferase [Chryseobacterium pennipullorum]|uniref:GNAT family N-acetyltransferase n=1 Tax=Chryseobacterium pennipullorum TaxID=2258963 RepID=A0A3D9B9V8_9FLAO|nr:GNAT family N-acetyltransferase [Chryseobacterium pennipullorum]REC50393.1 GNAT family N-acetyltransferase [Chryseobacterium pennipullorum]